MVLKPFQCLHYCFRSASQKSNILLCASVYSIYSFDISNGSLLSRWPSWPGISAKESEEHKDFKSYERATSPALQEHREANGVRPLKRQKLSPERESFESTSTEIVVDDEKPVDRDFNRLLSLDPSAAVIKLAGTSNGQYVVAVTDEDKCIRVMELHDDGSLRQRSARPMPKRPCSIALAADESTILCADKFGDVHSLPLLGLLYEPTNNASTNTPTRDDAEKPPRPFIPAATSKTVHTKKNLESLRQQLKQANQKPEKKSLQFEHQLLLGHVSLLTDVASVTLAATESPSAPQRSYILTSDRDEHIRVSRGIPQTSIIENYCLGHTEFVSKLCIPDWNKRLLISGSGDDFLLVWDWISGTVRQKIDLDGPLESFKTDFMASLTERGDMVATGAFNASSEVVTEKLETEGPVDGFGHEYSAGQGLSGTEILNVDGEERRIAVSGIWAVENNPHQGHVLVALEGSVSLSPLKPMIIH